MSLKLADAKHPQKRDETKPLGQAGHEQLGSSVKKQNL